MFDISTCNTDGFVFFLFTPETRGFELLWIKLTRIISPGEPKRQIVRTFRKLVLILVVFKARGRHMEFSLSGLVGVYDEPKWSTGKFTSHNHV